MQRGQKSPAERTIEALTWAAVVIWLGFALVTHLLGYVFLVVMVLSIILLSSAIYQRSQGWHTSLSIWIFGIWMAVFSVVELVNVMLGAISGSELSIDLWVYLGIALLSMGVAVVMRTIAAPGVFGGEQGEVIGAPGGEGRPFIPQHVPDTFSSGQTMPPGATGRPRQRQHPSDYDAGWDEPTGVPHDTYHATWPPSGQPGTRQGRRPSRPAPDYDAGWDQPQQPQHQGGYGQGPPDYDSGWDQPPQQPRQSQGQPPDYDSGWDQPPQQPRQSQGQPPDYDSGWDQPPQQPRQSQGQPPGYDADWGQPQQPQQPPQQYQQSPVRRARRRRNDPSRRSRPPRQEEMPPDLDARIDNIIQRSRQQREEQDDLPY